MPTLSWVLIYISLLGNPLDPDIDMYFGYNTMSECFDARDEILGYRDHAPRGMQAVCIPMEAFET